MNKKIKKNLIMLCVGASVLTVPAFSHYKCLDKCLNAGVYTVHAAETGSVTLDVSKGDDITEKLQEAVKNYAVVNIPKGTYKCSGLKLNDLDGVTINAEGCTIKLTGSGPLVVVQDSHTAANITINGGTWDGNDVDIPVFRFNGTTSDITLKNLTATNSKSDGVRFKATNGVNLENVSVTDNGGYGISFTSIKKGGYISKCTVKNNKNTGIILVDCKDVGISSSQVSYNGGSSTGSGHGLYISDSTAQLDSLTVEYNYWCGISVTGSKSVVSINKGEYSHNGTRPDQREDDDTLCAGIGIYKGATATADEVTCSSNHGSGMAIASTKASGYAKITVKGCTIVDNNDHGIGGHPYAIVNVKASSGGKRNTISGNTTNGILFGDHCKSSYISDADVSNNGNMGISFVTSSKGKYIQNCTFSGNKQDGVRLSKNSSISDKIANCTFSGNGRSGIGIYDKSKVNTIQKCTIKASKSSGIRVSKSEVSGITDTKITKSKESGINLEKSSIKKISGCTVSSNKKYGIYCGAGSSTAIKSSTVNSNTVDGVRVTGSSASASITKCVISSNGENGVIVVSKGKVTQLSNCTIKSNKKYGVAVYKNSTLKKSSGNKIKKNSAKQIYVQEGARTSLKTK